MISKNQIKYIRQLGSKKYRQKFGQYLVEGEKMVELAVRAGKPIQACVSTGEWYDQNSGLLQQLDPAKIFKATHREMKKISNMKTPPPVMAVLDMPISSGLNEKKLLKAGIYLYLESMRDPGNLGTIIRTADWFGINAMFYSEDSVEAFNPKVVQASMGSIFNLVPAEVEFDALRSNNPGANFVAAVLNGEDPASVPVDLSKPLVICIGNESRGLSPAVENNVNWRVSIPGAKEKTAESLNAAAASAVLCFIFSRMMS